MALPELKNAHAGINWLLQLYRDGDGLLVIMTVDTGICAWGSGCICNDS